MNTITKLCKENGATILTGLGVAGVVSTAVMTANSARQLSSLANRLSFGHNTTPDEELTNLKKEDNI